MSDDLHLEVNRDGDTALVVLNGYLNQPGGEHIVEVCNKLIEEGARGLVFNMTHCGLMNSVGASCLIEILENVADAEGKVAFFGAKPIINKTFRIMGLVQLASVHEEEAEALEAVKG